MNIDDSGCSAVSLPSGDSNLTLHLLIVQLHLLQGGCQPIQLALHLFHLQCTITGSRLQCCLCVWIGAMRAHKDSREWANSLSKLQYALNKEGLVKLLKRRAIAVYIS